MQIIETYTEIPDSARGAVVAIGNFDGVHRGHQVLLKRARDIAAERKKPFAVLTFEPHPRRLFRPDEPPGRITPKDVKAWRLEQAGADILFSIPFDWDFASQSAGAFVKNVLRDGLGAAHIVTGYDFRFGQMRKGGVDDIQAAGLDITVVDAAQDREGEILSSSRVRQALRHGKIREANAVLGWDWELRGTVIKGDRRGRELGYPTANFDLGETIHPAYGVYAARVKIEGEQEWRGAAVNIGIRPMFEIECAQVESFIFDFDREIYGQTLCVQPVERLRSEAKFASLDDLIAQINEDCAQAREILDA